MITAVYLLLIVVILYASGFALTFWLLPERLRPYRWLVMPTVGLAALIALAGALNLWGLPTRIGGPLALLILAGGGVLYVRKRRPDLSLSGSHWRPLWISAAGTVAAAWPMFYCGAGYMSYVNDDAVNYCAVAKFLQVGSYRNPPQYDALRPLNRTTRAVIEAERVGAQFLLSSVASVLGEDPRPVYMPLIFALYFLGPPCLFALMAGFSRMEEREAALAAFLLAFSSTSAFGYLYQLLAQATGVPLTILTLGLAYSAWEEEGWKAPALASVATAATASTYVEILPFALGPAGLAGLWLLWKRRVRFRRLMLIGAALPAACVALLTPLYCVRLGEWFLNQALRGVGRGISTAARFPYMLTETGPPALFGLLNVPFDHWPLSFSGLNGLRGMLVLAALCFAVALLGVWRLLCEGRHALAGLFLLSAALFAQLFRGDSGFGALKLAMYIQFLLAALLATGAGWLWRGRGARAAVAKAFVAAVVILNVTALATYTYASLGRRRGMWVEWSGISENNGLPEVRKAAASLPPGSRIVIGVVDLLPMNWLTYTLWDFPVRYLYNSDAPSPPGWLEQRLPQLHFRPDRETEPPGVLNSESANGRLDTPDTYFLVWNDSQRPSEIVVSQSLCDRSVWRNATFCLVPGPEVRDLVVPVGTSKRSFWYLDIEGNDETSWYAVEEHPGVAMGRLPFRQLNDDGALAIYKPSEAGMRLAMDLVPGRGEAAATGEYLQEQRIILWYGNERIDEVRVRGLGRYISPPLPTGGDVGVIRLDVAEILAPRRRTFALWKPHIPADYRLLNVSLFNVRLLSDADYRRLDVPEALDLSAAGRGDWYWKAAVLNGVYEDRWVSREVETLLRRPPDARQFILAGHVPQAPWYSLPIPVELLLDGEAAGSRQITEGGDFVLRFSIPERKYAGEYVRATVRTDRFFLPNQVGFRADPRELSFELRWLGFR